MARKGNNSLTFPAVVLDHIDPEHPLFVEHHKYRDRGYGRDEFTIYGDDLSDDRLTVLAEALPKVVGNKTATAMGRIVEAILAARAGDHNKPIPRLQAAPEMLLAYFRANLADGWVYRKGPTGHLQAWLVTDVTYRESQGNGDRPSVSIHLAANGQTERRGGGGLGSISSSVTLWADNVTKKRVEAVLTDQRLYVETPALREQYDADLAVYTDLMREGFAQQYRYTGQPSSGSEDSYRTPNPRVGIKVIHDVKPDEVPNPSTHTESSLFNTADDDSGIGALPIHFDLRVFDLHAHEFLWVNGLDLTRYEYDKSLGDKIVLPEDQRNLLDILTTNLDDFTGDVIEGKSAGNVVLAKGEPGVGKTLTAEVYSELIERPLYSIHSGNLGITADTIRKNLETVFGRAQRWEAVLLLDEADVFVLERGDNIEQNAIVAEFLRTLEYFTGLMFMTTNRADNIDDAILSRAAAIIDYALPDKAGIRAVWQVQARNQGVDLGDDLLDSLVDGFAKISPRDVKMLLRLALRVARGNGVDLDVDTFRRCAMFRGLHYAEGSRR